MSDFEDEEGVDEPVLDDDEEEEEEEVEVRWNISLQFTLYTSTFQNISST